MHLFALIFTTSLLLATSSFAQKSKPPSEQAVSGTIYFEQGSAPGGELYLTVTTEASERIKVEKAEKIESLIKKDEKVPVSTGNQVLNLGGNTGKPVDFSLLLAPGRYHIGCLVKIGEPPCSEYRVNNGKTVETCIPGKKDLICTGTNVEVENSSIHKLSVKVGLPAK